MAKKILIIDDDPNYVQALVTLLEAKGDPKDPTELVLELPETQEKVTVAPDRPYVRVDGYEADLEYPPDDQEFHDVRVGATLPGAGNSPVPSPAGFSPSNSITPAGCSGSGRTLTAGVPNRRATARTSPPAFSPTIRTFGRRSPM